MIQSATVLDPGLKRLFRPESIALVGVSTDTRNLGHRYLRHLLAHGFPPERLQVVHPTATDVGGIPAVPTIDALEGVPDLGLVLTSGGAVPGLIAQLVERGVGAFNVFANDGPVIHDPDGLRTILGRTGARLLGPNSPGFVTSEPPIAAHASQFLGSAKLRSRPAGIISHSGAIGGIVANALLESGSGFASLICTGNEVDLGLGECLQYLVAEEQLRVIGLFIESVRDVDRFRAGLEHAAEQDVRVCVLKVGWSEAAQRAARQHTGADTGRMDLFEAELHAAGATLCRDLNEMVSMLVVGSLPRPTRSGLAIGATSGGLTSVLGDAATHCGLDVPELAGFDNPWDTDIHAVHASEATGARWIEMLARDEVGCGVFAVSAQPDHVWTGLVKGMNAAEEEKPFVVIPYAGMPDALIGELPPNAAVWLDAATALRALAWASGGPRHAPADPAREYLPDTNASTSAGHLPVLITADAAEVQTWASEPDETIWLWKLERAGDPTPLGPPLRCRADALPTAWRELEPVERVLAVRISPGHGAFRVTIDDDLVHGTYATIGVLGGEDVSVLLPATSAAVERLLMSAPHSPFAGVEAAFGPGIVARLAATVLDLAASRPIRLEPLVLPVGAGASAALTWKRNGAGPTASGADGDSTD